MRAVRDRRRVLAAFAAVCVALGVAIPVATSASAGAGAAANLARARTEAARLLGLLHLPPGAVELSSAPAFGGKGVLGVPGYDEATPNLVDAHHWWTVKGNAKQVLAYVTARVPRGAKSYGAGSGGPRPVYHVQTFALAPIPGLLSERVLSVTVVQLNRTTTAIRTDGEAVWITPRPASERVPAGVREIDIASTAFMSRSPILALRVTEVPEVRQLVKWINAMPTAQPGSISCPSLAGPTVTFMFRAAAGNAVARASGMYFDGTSGQCNPIQLWIHGQRQTPLIGGDFYGRVERLLGVRFERSSMSSRRVTVLDVLTANSVDGVRFGASPAAVRAAIDSLLGQSGGPYQRDRSCGLDHQISWADEWTANGEPALTAYFSHGRFAGYQVGDPPGAGVLRWPPGGWAPATTRGLRVGDTLLQGRKLYGRAFTISAAQGGDWMARTDAGPIGGYAWGYGQPVLSWHNFVATIDAGDVGCAALSP